MISLLVNAFYSKPLFLFRFIVNVLFEMSLIVPVVGYKAAFILIIGKNFKLILSSLMTQLERVSKFLPA